MNPSDNSTLIQLAEELNLDGKQLTDDLVSEQIQVELEQNFALRRRIGVHSFPSLVLEQGQKLSSIEVDYRDYRPSLETILRQVP